MRSVIACGTKSRVLASEQLRERDRVRRRYSKRRGLLHLVGRIDNDASAGRVGAIAAQHSARPASNEDNKGWTQIVISASLDCLSIGA